MVISLSSKTEGYNEFLSLIRPKKFRTYREFAEQEIRLPPGGPREGQKFKCSFMPWTADVLDEFQAGVYRRFWASGPVQSGKTLVFFCIPILYHVFEIGENVIVGVPKVEMAQDIFQEKILPTLNNTRYRDLLPKTGAGSRGGKFNAITFTNGAILRFMGAGGGDEQRSSHTARVVVITEADKMDEAGASSREADPVTQFEARNKSFRDRGLVFGECTMSFEDGRIYREVVKYGTNTTVWINCPYCEKYIKPEREYFQGWQGAENMVRAQKNCYYECPSCSSKWDENDRTAALKKQRLVHEGQTIDEQGKVEGDPKETNTFGFCWNAMVSPLVSMGSIAESEFKADDNPTEENVKSVHQFVWALPYNTGAIKIGDISVDIILEKITGRAKGVVPKSSKAVTCFIDLGLYTCWFAVFAWMEGAIGHVIDYGPINVPQERKADPMAILSALRSFRDDVISQGWLNEDGTMVTPKAVLVDSGWKPDIAYHFVDESGNRYMASKGLGSGRHQQSWSSPKPGKNRTVADEWMVTVQPNGVRLVTMHSDYWKSQVHQGFSAPSGSNGSLSLYSAQKRDHITFARHITAEIQREEFEQGTKGKKVYWDQISRENHYFDCAYGNRCAADMLNIRHIEHDLTEIELKARMMQKKRPPNIYAKNKVKRVIKSKNRRFRRSY